MNKRSDFKWLIRFNTKLLCMSTAHCTNDDFKDFRSQKKNSISKGYSSKLMNQFINSQNFINGHGKIE